jgi:hypothetical protein
LEHPEIALYQKRSTFFMKKELDGVVDSPGARRKFLKQVGATSIGVAAMTMLGSGVDSLHAATTITDTDILNFALNLEYLEGEFYSVATFGSTLEQRGIIPVSAVGGPTTGGKMVPGIAKSIIAYVAAALRYDEEQHIIFLRAALGSAAVKKPAINLDALGFGFDGVNDFLKLSRIFEDVGVSAYLGAAPLIESKTYLDAAARIMDTEAQHSGTIRDRNIQFGISSPAVDSKDVPPTQKHPFFVDSKGLTIPRSTSEVLNIVYHGGNCSGGFYPSGMNGTIKCQH